MIGDILQLIAKEVSTFIDNDIKLPSGKKSVILHKPNSINGEFNLPDNAISMSLLNIEEEKSTKSAMVQKRVQDRKVYTQNPVVNLNLDIIFISNFANDYLNELNYITKVVEFFQQKRLFTIENTEALKEFNIERLNFMLNTLPLNEQNNIWSLLGGKYMPSVIYRVGLIPIQDEEKLSQVKIVRTVDIDSDIVKNIK